ncbi:MAG TPA: PCMD domain-containing protein [Candidatus Coprenecus stercoravium]|uniref:PCMD domain-containing protein n=1 Tax=Candidatus Coprenecus stercoravium TaxID=2840735 RepID=A0A9D2GRA1_9BACT|nr:PCMD domain-containing protein [Candidatus Coprenecus stercoravium]
MRSSVVFLTVAAVLVISGCIKNDIPYPKRLGKITAFEVSGQTGEAVIDSTALTVSVSLADTVLPDQVRLLRFETSDNTTVSPEADSLDILNMSQPLVYELTTWPGQTYRWTVTASQTIERYIRVRNQIGDASINADECEAVVYVTLDTPLDSIEITEMKLGPSGSVIDPDPAGVSDFRQPRTFTVTYRDRTQEWTVAVIPKEVTLTTSEADAWACCAYLSGMVPEGFEAPGFRYRKASDTEWTEVQGVETDGSDVTALLTGLEPATEYVYKIFSGEMEGREVSFITEEAAQMPNMGFDQWNTTGGIVFPNADQGDNFWWDSGNTGAKLGGKTPTSQETSFLATSDAGNTSAARLETVNAIIAMAGGNVFSGHFGSVQGLGAEVYFGRPFETRPLRLTGYYSYQPKPIDNVKPPEGVSLPFDRNTIAGKTDRCHIFVYVTAWDGPYRVNTTEHRYLNINDPDVIGYGELIDSTGTGGEYRQFSIDIKYRDHRRPTYCAVVAVASQYADFFTGGLGSLMYVDEFAFGYDGAPVWEE